MLSVKCEVVNFIRVIDVQGISKAHLHLCLGGLKRHDLGCNVWSLTCSLFHCSGDLLLSCYELTMSLCNTFHHDICAWELGGPGKKKWKKLYLFYFKLCVDYCVSVTENLNNQDCRCGFFVWLYLPGGTETLRTGLWEKFGNVWRSILGFPEMC